LPMDHGQSTTIGSSATENTVKLYEQLQPHPTATLAHAMRTLRHTRWSPAVKNFEDAERMLLCAVANAALGGATRTQTPPTGEGQRCA
jgi:hypothetical protein